MKLIIELSENDYKALKEEGVQNHIALADILIAHSIPYDEKPQGVWISVSEKLPPNYILCLFCTVDGDIFYGYRNSENLWREKGCTENISDVVAWQDLPNPCK